MTPTTDLQKLLAEVPPDYGYVQAVLTANLIRRGVIDQIIPREEMPEWAKVLADVAYKPLAARVLELEAENKRLRDANENLIYALENLEEESLTHYMRADSAMRVKCTLCGADDFMPSSLNHRQGCAVGVARAALKGGE